MKKIVLIGATGKLGGLAHTALNARGYEIILVSRACEISVDISNVKSIKKMYQQLPTFDHLVCLAGSTAFKPFHELTTDDFIFSFNNKLLGQINLVLHGIERLNSIDGSFTLIAGMLSRYHTLYGACAGVVNAAIETFCQYASKNYRNKCRINVLSPGLMENSYEHLKCFFPGVTPVKDDHFCDALINSIEGINSGYIYNIS